MWENEPSFPQMLSVCQGKLFLSFFWGLQMAQEMGVIAKDKDFYNPYTEEEKVKVCVLYTK